MSLKPFPFYRIRSPQPEIRAEEARIDEYDYKNIYFDPQLIKGDDLLAKKWREEMSRIDLSSPLWCSTDYRSVVDMIERGDSDAIIRERLISLAKNLRDQPYNAALYEQTSCALQSLAVHSMDQESTPQKSETYGSGANASVRGGLFSRQYRPIIFPPDEPPLFLLKTASPSEQGWEKKNWETINEAIVGMYALAPLRRIIPTFMYVYGTFKAGGAMEDWSFASGTQAQYNMLEAIDGVSFASFIHLVDYNNDGMRDLYEVFCQVYLALIIAKRVCGFVHADLSSTNVMIVKLPERMNIEFPGAGVNGESMFIETSVVAKIIDFGRSQARIPLSNGRFVNAGRYMAAFGLAPGNTSSIYDFTRLIGTSNLDFEDDYRIGFEWLEVLMGPAKRLSWDFDYRKDWNNVKNVAPPVGLIDIVDVFYAGLPAVRERCAVEGTPLILSTQPTDAPLLSCGNLECNTQIAPGTRVPTTPPKPAPLRS